MEFIEKNIDWLQAKLKPLEGTFVSYYIHI